MDNRLSFGIGCFHFGIKKIPPFEFRGSEYIKKLSTALQSISNINNINIYCEDAFKNESIDVTQELPNIGEGNGFFPEPICMDIEFEVYIPFQIQKQLLKGVYKIEALSLKTYTERFKISLHHTHYFPVTFIEPINPSQESTPSDAVIIVREFLKREFNSSKSDYIQFEYLGPSPFNADFYIQPGEAQDDSNVDWKFQAKIYPQKGYNEMVFYFNPRIFTKAEEAKKVIKNEIQCELGLFYKIVQREVVKMNDWQKIQKLAEDLVSIQRMTGIKGFLKKFVLSKSINEVFTSIVEFESDQIFFNNIRQKDYRDIYFYKKIDTYFKSYIDNEIKEQFIYPTEKTGQLTSFFESRRIKSVANFVIFITAIIGVVIGALLTKWIAKF